MIEKDGLRLVIELSAQEAGEFRRLAKTDDTSYLDGIAKSLVLGAGSVVVPEDALEDIELLNNMRSYGLRGDLRVRQEWADALSFTREQLAAQPVKDAIASWAVYFGDDIKSIIENRWTPPMDQVWWFNASARTSSLLEILRDTIKKVLYG